MSSIKIEFITLRNEACYSDSKKRDMKKYFSYSIRKLLYDQFFIRKSCARAQTHRKYAFTFDNSKSWNREQKNSDKCSENQANHCLFAHRFLEWFSGNWVTFLLDVRKNLVNQPSFFYLSLVRCYKFVSSSCSAIIANENIAKTHKSWRFQAIECEQ